MENQEKTAPQLNDQQEAPLTKAERKQLRRAEKIMRREKEAKRQSRNRIVSRSLWALAALALIGFVVWQVVKAPTRSNSDVVSTKEVHWHARLDISIKGKDIDIPANIGIPVGNPTAHPNNMHTHAADHIIHIEKMPPVYKDDLKLSNFFQVWGKKFTHDCILDSCNGSDGTVKFYVNGKENPDFENYLLKDQDQVRIIYE